MFGFSFEFFTSSPVDLGVDGFELASNMCSVAIKHWTIPSLDLTRVVEDDDLSEELSGFSGRVIFLVSTDISSFDIFDGDVFNVESNIVSRDSFCELFMVHFHRLDLGFHVDWGEDNVHTGLENSGFHSSYWDCSNTTDLVNILEGKSEWLVNGSFGGDDVVEGLEECGTLVPSHVGGRLDHVVTVPAGNGDERDFVGVVADFLKVLLDFGLDFLETGFSIVDGFFVHFVGTDDHLLDTEGEGEEGMFSGLAVFGDTGFELSFGGGDHEDGNIGLGSSCDHVFDEVSVARGVDDGEVVFGGLELPKGNVDGDTPFSFGFEFVKHPGVFERSLSRFGRFLFELGNGSFIDTSTLVNQVSGGCGFTSIHVSNDHQVNVNFVFL